MPIECGGARSCPALADSVTQASTPSAHMHAPVEKNRKHSVVGEGWMGGQESMAQAHHCVLHRLWSSAADLVVLVV